MPQLDVTTFLSQYVWLVIVLGIMYYKAVNSKELEELKRGRQTGK